MKKLFAYVLLVFPLFVHAGAWDMNGQQYDQFGAGIINRLMPIPSGGVDAIWVFEGSTNRPKLATFGTGLSMSGLVVNVSGFLQTPTGNTGQYIRGDGSLATFPAIPGSFNFGYPTSRSLSSSTDYQATDNTKPAVITVSAACTNATTVLAASACTLQVRMASTTLANCSAGTLYATISLTVNLGVLITQNSNNPVTINLPAGGHFMLCPTAGTFTYSTVEQTAN